MTPDTVFAVAIAAVAGGCLLVAALAWQRGTKTRVALQDKRAAQRARLAQYANADAAGPDMPRKAKQAFGRR